MTKQKKKDWTDMLLSKSSLPIRSFLLLLIPFSLLYQVIIRDVVASLVVTGILIISSLLFYRLAKIKIHYMGAVLLFLSFLTLIIENHFSLQETPSGLLHPVLFALFGMGSLMFYRIKIDFSFHHFKKIFGLIAASIGIAIIFLLLNEPFPGFLDESLILILIYTFFVSLGEELVFRGASFSLTRKFLSDKVAVHVQAGIFTVIHLFSIVGLYLFYDVNGSFLVGNPLLNLLFYAGALYWFSVIAAKYAMNKSHTSILYPIIFHWLVNFINIAVLMLVF